MNPSDSSSSQVDTSSFQYVVGVDIGMELCSFCILTPEKSQLVKPATIPNGASGFAQLHEKLKLLRLPPRQTHEFAQRRGLRAKTDKLDAQTITRVLLSGEARPGYVPGELITAYRELVRLHTQLTDEVQRYRNAIHAELSV